jgi:hypothetical protein
MSKSRNDEFWLSEKSDRRRLRDAENARKNRAEVSRRYHKEKSPAGNWSAWACSQPPELLLLSVA